MNTAQKSKQKWTTFIFYILHTGILLKFMMLKVGSNLTYWYNLDFKKNSNKNIIDFILLRLFLYLRVIYKRKTNFIVWSKNTLSLINGVSLLVFLDIKSVFSFDVLFSSLSVIVCSFTKGDNCVILNK